MLKWIVAAPGGRGRGQGQRHRPLPTDPRRWTFPGLDLSGEAVELLTSIDADVWREEAALIPAGYERFGDRLPEGLWQEYRALLDRLAALPTAETLANDVAPSRIALSA